MAVLLGKDEDPMIQIVVFRCDVVVDGRRSIYI